jgi:hypothetical protein
LGVARESTGGLDSTSGAFSLLKCAAEAKQFAAFDRFHSSKQGGKKRRIRSDFIVWGVCDDYA